MGTIPYALPAAPNPDYVVLLLLVGSSQSLGVGEAAEDVGTSPYPESEP